MVSAEDLADSIGKVGNAAKLSQTPLEELIGMTTAIVSSTGISGSEAGTAIKSMIARTFRIGEEGQEDAGKTEALLNKLGIAIRKNKDEFKPMGEIIAQLKEKWAQWSSVTKQQVAETIAGVYHYSKFIGLMEAYDIKVEATTKAQNSQNSAMEENKKKLESIEGRINALKVAFEKLSNSLINSEFVKGFVSFLTTLLNGFNKLSDFLGGMTPLIVGVSAALIALAVATGTLTSAFTVLSTALTGINIKLAGIPILVGLVVTAITALVMNYDKLIGKSEELNKQDVLELKNSTQKIEQRAKEAAKTDALIKRYDELTKKTSLNKSETLELKNTQQELLKLFPDLKAGINSVTGEYGLQIDRVKTLRDEQKALLKEQAKLSIAKSEALLTKAGSDINTAKAKYDTAVAYKPVSYEILSSLQSGKSIEDIKRYYPDSILKNATGLTGKMLDNPELVMQKASEKYFEYVEDISKNAEKLLETNEAKRSIEANKTLLEKINSGKLDEETSVIGETPTPKWFPPDDSKDKMPADINPETFMPEKNELEKYEQALGNINVKIAKNKADQEQINLSTEEQIKLKKEEIDLLEEQRMANNNLAWEAGRIAKDLKAKIGEKFFDAEGNINVDAYNKYVANESAIVNGMKAGDARNSRLTNLKNFVSDKKSYEDMMKKSNDYLVDKANSRNTKGKVSQEIQDIQDDVFVERMKRYGDSVKPLANELTNLEEKMQLVGENDFSQKLQIQTAMIEKQKEISTKLRSSIETLNFEYAEGKVQQQAFKEASEKLNSELAESDKKAASLTKGFGELKKSQKEYLDEAISSYVKYLKDQVEKEIDLIDKEKESYVKARNDEIDALKDKKDAYVETKNSEIDALQAQIDKERENNEELDLKIEKQDRLAKLEKEKQKLENLKNERTARVFMDGRFQYMADPNKVRDQQEVVDELKKDFDEWERKNNLKKDEKLLQDKIELKKQEIKAEEDRIEKQIKLLEDEIKKKEEKAEQNKNNLKLQLDSLDEIVKTSNENQITSFQQLIDKFNEVGGAAEKQYERVRNAVLALNQLGLNVGTVSTSKVTNPQPYNGQPLLYGSKVRDSGGIFKSGSTAVNLSGSDEYVLSPAQTRTFSELVSALPNMADIIRTAKINVPSFGGIASGLASADNSITINVDKVITNNAQDFLNQLKRLVRS